jgi:ribulose-bisphosphate carboxylase large chain
VRAERIEADYLIETAYDVRKAVEAMAGEQSSGTFLPFRAKPRSSRRAWRRAWNVWKCSARLNSRPPGIGRSSRGRPTHDGARHAFLAAREHWTITA